MRSPAWSPDRMITSEPTRFGATCDRTLRGLVVGTDDPHEILALQFRERALRHQNVALAGRQADTDAGKHAGAKGPGRIRKFRPPSDGRRGRVHHAIHKDPLARFGMLRAIGQDQVHRQLAHFPSCFPGQAIRLEKIHFTDRTVKPNRIDLRDGREERGLALPDEAAHRHRLRADAPRQRRPHITIPEIQFRRFHLRLSGRHLGLVRFLRGHGGVEILLGSGLLCHERREPGNFQTAPGQRGLGFRQHSLRSRELLFVRLLIEFK